MNYNDLFYKPKRLNRESLIRNRVKYLSFLSAMLMLMSLSGDNPREKQPAKAETNLESKEFISKLVSYSSLNTDTEKIVTRSKYVKATTEVLEDDITDEQETVPEVIEEPVKEIVNVPVMVDAAQFALNIKEILKDIPNEVKYDYILEHFKCPSYEFEVIQSTVQGEAKPQDENLGRYIDAFACINNVYDRMASKTKCSYTRVFLKKDGPITMYDHIIAPGQYQPYGDGDYLAYMGVHSGEAYQAVLDFLYIADKNYGYMHPYLDFMAHGLGYSDSVAFTPGGNEFRYPLTSKDTIPLSERYYMIEDIVLEESSEPTTEEIAVTENDDSEIQEGITDDQLTESAPTFESEFIQIPTQSALDGDTSLETESEIVSDDYSLSLHR